MMNAQHPIEDTLRKMCALGIWEKILPCHWAVRTLGVSFPFFVSVMRTTSKNFPWRIMLMDGWQSFHDYLSTNADPNFGFYSTPFELPHYEVTIPHQFSSSSCPPLVHRHDPGYLPRPLTEKETEVMGRVLWECYGIMLRIESEGDLVMKYAHERAIFCRAEHTPGEWRDEPLAILQPRPHVEKITIAKKDVAVAKDLPFRSKDAVAVDLRIVFGKRIAASPRPLAVYELICVDMVKDEVLFRRQTGMNPELGLRGLWEGLAPRLLKEFISSGSVPGEIHVRSQRAFRMLRVLCNEIPFKLALHDTLPILDK